MANADDYRSDGPELDRLISRRELRERVPVSDMTIWRWQQAGIFPGPIRIGGRNFWRASEVEACIARHASSGRNQGAQVRACSHTTRSSEG